VKVKSILFDINDTLYDASLQIQNARLNAVRAMIEAGLPVEVENGYRVLDEVVEKYGGNYPKLFDKLLERLGLKWNPRVIAAGVVAYRETNSVYLKPYPDTIPTLLKLRDRGYKLGIISDGIPVKQWQKLIQLGIQHFFQHVVISEEQGYKSVAPELFRAALAELDAKPTEAVFIGNDLETDILSANKAGVTSIRIRRGNARVDEPKSPEVKPKYEISKLSELFEILKRVEDSV